MRSVLLIGLCLLSKTIWAAAQLDPFPQVATAYLVEVDGVTVWEKQAHKQLPQASLTKLMTALLVLERGRLTDTQTISHAVIQETGSRIKLKLGEHLHVQDLLAATLISSANDACHALAEHDAGNEVAFVKRMNQRAQQLGLHNTHFQNACGHDAPEHYSSVGDLARLAHELLKHQQVLALTSQARTTIVSQEGTAYPLANKNALIGRYNGALGFKTGYTPRAGKCLVAYARRGEHQVLLVLLHGKDRWWDAADMLDLAFAHANSAP